MINIDADLQRAASGAASWSPKAARGVAERLVRTSSFKIDWDEGAGELWLRILDGRKVTSLVSVALPLAIVEGPANDLTDDMRDVIIISVDDLDEIELSCSPAVLGEVFGSLERFKVIDPSGFSANDLWYATV